MIYKGSAKIEVKELQNRFALKGELLDTYHF